MATPKQQRIGIWIILIAMIIGTIGSFAVMILATQNQKTDQARQTKAYEKFTKEYEEYQEKVNAQTQQLSREHYDEFKKYEDYVKKFDATKLTKLSKTDLKIGDGATIDGDSSFAAYYIGWLASGKIFDQSIADDALKAPFPIESLDQATVIEGWKEGLKGMKIGGVRLLEIPADKAYGDQGSGDVIPPNSPLKFVIMAIEQPKKIEQPAFPEGGLGL